MIQMRTSYWVTLIGVPLLNSLQGNDEAQKNWNFS